MDDAREPRRRWWELQMVGSPRVGYVLGSLALVCGLAELIVSVTEAGHVWSIVMGVYFAFYGLLTLLGARAKSHDARTAGSSSDQPPRDTPTKR